MNGNSWRLFLGVAGVLFILSVLIQAAQRSA